MTMVRSTFYVPPGHNRLIVAARTVPDDWGRNVQAAAFHRWCERQAGWDAFIMGHYERHRWRPGATLARAYTWEREGWA